MNGNKFSSADLHKSDVEAIDFGLAVLSPRWTSEILIDLSAGAKRTTHMLRDLPGISAKTLCQRLRRLCELQLVNRTTFPEVPPRVEYNLTAKGEELTYVLSALKVLGKELLTTSQNSGGRKRSLKDVRLEAKDVTAKEQTSKEEQEMGLKPEHTALITLEHEIPIHFLNGAHS
ncbi:winged helix-turn-helix transcriptional regulator [bacterium]|nr:winged helix-turn-helix transcriptional regulator [bacterium]MBP9807359.1 winged helix-turn-helix transcriptional regulator [bacterium]